MKGNIFYYSLLFLGLFFIFWAISFYYYNPTIVRVESVGMLGRQAKLMMSLIFFWGSLLAGLGLVGLSIYKLFFRKKETKIKKIRA